jgi:4-amino-4-deoxy-L-arabinose transferase-like glycosyltransferase
MKLKHIFKNHFFLFLPFFILYIIIILICATPDLYGDESRYLAFATNLTHGFFSPPPPLLDLGNGPGYPLIMAPFIALKLPVIIIKLLNAVFYYISVVLLFKALKKIVPYKFAIIISLAWALYPNTFEEIPYALSEVFASSLVPLFIFCVTFAFNNVCQKIVNKYIIAAGLTLGYLALTKPIFGYVMLTMILGAVVLAITNRKSISYKKVLSILMIAFGLTVPWLAYTYHMTGRILYWSSFGGNNLYWMSSPNVNEYGDWHSHIFDDINEPSEGLMPGSAKIIQSIHEKDFKQIFDSPEARKLYIKDGKIHGKPYTGLIQDDVLKRIAYENIKSHPVKFIQNCLSNAGRMIFNYPTSFTLQKPSTLKRLPVNGTLLVLSAFCFIMTVVYWRKILFPVRFLLFFGLIYFGGSILGSAEPRMFTVIVPILLFWIAYILQRSVKIKSSFNE